MRSPGTGTGLDPTPAASAGVPPPLRPQDAGRSTDRAWRLRGSAALGFATMLAGVVAGGVGSAALGGRDRGLVALGLAIAAPVAVALFIRPRRRDSPVWPLWHAYLAGGLVPPLLLVAGAVVRLL